MKTNQPNWKVVARLGDVHPVDAGNGHIVYADTTGVYPPESEVLVESGVGYRVYRYTLDKCTFIDGVLSDNKYHPECPAWFSSNISGLISSMDCPDIVQWLCGDDIINRALAYYEIGLYWGFENLDNYSTFYTEKEIRKFTRWRKG